MITINLNTSVPIRSPLLILLEIILPTEIQFGFFVLVGEICHPARAEVDVPAPETAKDTLGILVVLCPKTASRAGEFLFSHNTT